MIYHKDIRERQHVCPHCDHHMRIGPADRLEPLFDNGDYTAVELPDVPEDPLKFRDTKRYPERMKEARSKTGQNEALTVVHGRMGGLPVVVAVQNFAFMGGSLGMAAGEAIIAAAKLAVLQQASLLIFSAAGGARMQEGILSLMQLPRTTIAVQMVREAGLPYISIMTDPTTGGVTASYAMLGDVAIAEPGALIGFAGPRVIENTIRERLPEGFQRAEYLFDHGMLDMVVHRHELRATLIKIIGILTGAPPPAAVVTLQQSDAEAAQSGDGTDEPGLPA
jgi:acetyl-CoA carboxylase carboxyl transferase subunit beta